MLLALVVFVALVAATALAVVRPGPLAAAITLVLAVAWLAVDSPVEGPVLLTLSRTHGVTAADMAGVIAVVIAATNWRARLTSTPASASSETAEPDEAH